MKNIIVITEQALELVTQDSQEVESISYALCGLSEGKGERRFLVRSVAIPRDEDYVARDLCSARTSADFVFSIYERCRNEELPVLLFSHTHPMSAYFSAKDEHDIEIHLNVLGDFRIRYYIRIVVGPDGLVADVHQRQENGSLNREVIDRILLYKSKGIDTIIPKNSSARHEPAIDCELHDRTLKIGGDIEKALGIISDLTLFVIGAGGIGNTFLEFYKHLNPGKLIIVDDDVLEKSNANRFLGYRPEDEGKPKVDIIKRELLQWNPDMEIETYQERFPSEKSMEAFKSSDMVIPSVDNNMTRLVASRLACQYCKLLLSAGAAIYADENGHPYRLSCSVWIQLPPPLGPCLRCMGLRSEYAPEYEEMIRDARRSYIRGYRDLGPTPGSIITLHSMASMMLLRSIIYYLSSITDEQVGLVQLWDEVPQVVQDLTPLFPRQKDCPVCGDNGYWSYGDCAPTIPTKAELEAELAESEGCDG